MPFFPRVLAHLVGLDRRVIQQHGVGRPERLLLEPVPQLQQMLPVAVQLTGQPRRGRALGDAPEDQEDLRGAAVGLGEDGLGEGVEDAAAGGAAVVQDRVAGATMDPEAVACVAAWAGQTVRVEEGDDLLVASVLVHELGDGEVPERLRCRNLRCDPDPPSLPGEGIDPQIYKTLTPCCLGLENKENLRDW
jgi:hypothetical protein